MSNESMEKKQEELEDTQETVAECAEEEINEPAEIVDKGDSELDEMNSRLEQLELERDEYRDALVQERADFENYKKRNATLSSDSYKNGVIDTVSAILPVLDNFERALLAECADSAFGEGMHMIMRQLQGVLDTLGVERIETEGQFDPALHNAVAQVEEDGYQPNDIVETLQNGYRLKDRILRHAMVKVNK